MDTNANIRQIQLSDAAALAPAEAVVATDELVILDDLQMRGLTGKAVQIGFLAVCFCRSGSATIALGEKEAKLEAGSLFVGVGEPIVSILDVSPDFKMSIALVQRSLLDNSIIGLHQLWQYLLYLYNHPILPLEEDEQMWVDRTFTYLKMRFARKNHAYLDETIAALIRLFYFDICDLLSRHCVPLSRNGHSAGSLIFERFIALLGEHFKHERSITWYAEQLCITPKYLSEIVKSVSGRTAGQWVTNFVILEVKQLLANTPLSIKEIAQELHFANQSFLGKYFRNATGMSPSDFRKE